MKFLILNYPFFSEQSFRKLGIETLSYGIYPECDIRVTESDFNYQNLILKVPGIEEFSAVFYIDSLDNHLLFPGLNNFNIPKLYYAVDSTINFFWQKYFCQLFDYVFIDQPLMYKSFLPYANNLNILLLAADEFISFKDLKPFAKREYDLTFVGRRNSLTRGKRENILQRIRNLPYKIKIIDGENDFVSGEELYKVYQNSKIIINEQLFPSINLRIFEIGSSGAVLLNEELSAFLSSYFAEEQDYYSYNSENLEYKIQSILGNPEKSSEIAENFNQKIREYHTETRRLKQILKVLEKESFLKKVANNYMNLFEINTYFLLKQKWPLSNQLYKINRLDNWVDNRDEISLVLLENLLVYYAFIGEISKITEFFDNYFLIITHNIELAKICYWSIDDKKIRSRILNEVISHYQEIQKFKFLAENPNDASSYFLWGMLLKIAGVEVINFGFTTEQKPEFLYTQFDFFLKSWHNGVLEREALLHLVEILKTANAYCEALKLYEELFKIDSSLKDKFAKEFITIQKKSYNIV